MAERRRSTNVAPTAPSPFDAPVPSPAERRAAGAEHREAVPLAAHAWWEATADRRDPIELLVESNRTRVQDLVPLRYARMAVSPFTFLRGSALVMAHDLAMGRRTDLDVRLCGDAHVANFGIFASPERRLVFDLNDFDESTVGPFEWDVKRLAASIVVAGRDAGHGASATRTAVLDAVAEYRAWTKRYSKMTHLDVWYSRIEVDELLATLKASDQRQLLPTIEKMAAKNHLKALAKLTDEVDGRRRILDDPPIVVHADAPGSEVHERLSAALSQYRDTLSADRRALFDRYRFVDFARKVVGVGSVGTRCWIALFQGPNGGPLFLQLKEAGPPAPDLAIGRVRDAHHGQRVVEGQRMLQSSSDVLLGWATDQATGIHYYVRQLWDSKGSFDLATMKRSGFNLYVRGCARVLARAHARTGDSLGVYGYVGSSDEFDESIAEWSHAYADQTERDHAALVAAIERGALPTA